MIFNVFTHNILLSFNVNGSLIAIFFVARISTRKVKTLS